MENPEDTREDVLFEEYVDRIRKNFHDPELRRIEMELIKLGFHPSVPEDEWIELTELKDGSKIFAANIYLIGPSGEKEISLMAVHLRKYAAPRESEFDREFLKRAEIKFS